MNGNHMSGGGDPFLAVHSVHSIRFQKVSVPETQSIKQEDKENV
jgi:hypothetical protein